MKTKLGLKVVGVIGVLALISAGYCFWLMTVPLSYDWVYRCSDRVCRVDRRVCHLVDQFSYRPYTIASITSCIACSANQADHLTSRLNRH
jgi:hypothetical protein